MRNRAGLREYLRGVWEELKKVVWPGREELLRMTGIVLATVLIFGLLIGGADYLLSLAVRQLYTSSSTTTTTTAAPTRTTQTSAAPTVIPSTAPTSAASSAPIISP